MDKVALYPLSFEPIFQYRLWGGRRLGSWLNVALPGDGPIGEAWLLSDRDEHPSRVASGPLEGRTVAQLMARSPEPMLGGLAQRFSRFPLLVKFLDVQKMLSVQVHPRDEETELIPEGNTWQDRSLGRAGDRTEGAHLCWVEARHDASRPPRIIRPHCG
jgi:mannose-6-phosphate isomerase